MSGKVLFVFFVLIEGLLLATGEDNVINLNGTGDAAKTLLNEQDKVTELKQNSTEDKGSSLDGANDKPTPVNETQDETEIEVPSLEEKQKQDAAIQQMLFGDTPNIHECLNITFKRKPTEIKRNDTKYEKPVWTVVILKEEVFENKTLKIQQCTGSLIHPKVVLTAAHCLFKKPLTGLTVRAGECNRRPERNSAFHQERRIVNVTFQRAYDPTKPKRDIALLFLNESFTMTAHVKTVCLPPPRVQPDVDYVRCFATGWQRKSNILVGHANFRKLDLPVIPSDKCEAVLRLTGLGEDFNLHKSFMCAGGELDKDMLDGNGGAPLVCPICGVNGRLVQVGVMSWGFRSAPLPDVFTSISSARHWIMEQLQAQKLKLPGCGIKWQDVVVAN